MNFAQIFLGLFCVFGTLAYSSAITCYSCNTKSSCQSPTKVNCTTALAIQTRSYLDLHYQGVNTSTTSNTFECLRDYLTLSTGEYYYKGCIFNNITTCQLQLRDYHLGNSYTRNCKQCSDYNLCNPAARPSMNVIFGLMAPLIAAVFGKYFIF